jgi:hypothetical protein
MADTPPTTCTAAMAVEEGYEVVMATGYRGGSGWEVTGLSAGSG